MSFFNQHREGVIGVIIYLAIVFALLLLLGMYKPDPPPPEEGIVLDFGGSGSGTPDPGQSTPQPVQSNQSEQQTPETPPESNMTQDFEESVAMPDYNTTEESDTETTETSVDEEQEEPEPEEQVNETVSDMMNTNWDNTSDSDADGEGAGNPGSGNDGDGGDGGGEGPGSGNVSGNGWSLSGRAAESLPKPSVANCDGYVIVVIEVDRSGKVINAYAKPGGCTACESHCIQKAVSSAKKARFNADNSAKIRQTGSITYNFRPQ